MEPDQPPTRRSSTPRAVRHHWVVVVVLLALGGLAGYAFGAASPVRYTSSTRVLINPAAGNPFSPTPSSVRQDQDTSLQTEAEVVGSDQVLGAVAKSTGLAEVQIQRGLQVSVPPSTQVLEISYTAADKTLASKLADSIATAYLANRAKRSDDVTAAQLTSVETQTVRAVNDLRAATAAAQVGTPGKRAFNHELADALRNELVSLRAQRTALENTETPAGAVISPAGAAVRAGALTQSLMPPSGALAGLVLGICVAVLVERARGRVRSAADVEAAGLPVLAVQQARTLNDRLRRHDSGAMLDTAVRRLRARLLELEPRPDVVTVARTGGTAPETLVSEALAESLARAGHRVVLVQTGGQSFTGGLAVGVDGLAEALQHERLSVLDLLQPSVEPLLSLLPPGQVSAQTRDLLDPERLRGVLSPLVDAGHFVVVQGLGAGTVDGDAMFGAADVGLVVVEVGQTRLGDLEAVAAQPMRRGTTPAAVVVEARGRLRRSGSRFGVVSQGSSSGTRLLAGEATRSQSVSGSR